MVQVEHIWRHPIKGLGHEAVQRTALHSGQAMPWDRHWAVAHENAKVGPDLKEWAPCANFNRGAAAPKLMAVDIESLPETNEVILSHPERPDLKVDPDSDGPAIVDWATPLVEPGRAAPSHIVRIGARGMTDTPFPSISILNLASLEALSREAGASLEMERFRGNIWLSGVPAWQEFDWIDHEVRIGAARLRVRERITRCKATMANPATGIRDVDTLAALQSGWDHRDFGIYAEVIQDGDIALGDAVEIV